MFVPVYGKIEELRHLDDFIWATLKGWGALPAREYILHRSRLRAVDEVNPEANTEQLIEDLKAEEEEHARLLKFASDQAGQDYPYLFSLVAVRLWAMVEAAAREFVVEGVRQPIPLPAPGALAKLKGPIAPFIGADSAVQSELVADALWQSVEGTFTSVERFDAVLDRLGFSGDLHTTTREVLLELAEVRHCVVHRNGLADQRLLSACPWLRIKVGGQLPATIHRYWFYRTAAYAYFMDLLQRWSKWRSVPKMLQLADTMEATVLSELIPGWKAQKRSPGRPQPLTLGSDTEPSPEAASGDS
jgi:hypothetical protein